MQVCKGDHVQYTDSFVRRYAVWLSYQAKALIKTHEEITNIACKEGLVVKTSEDRKTKYAVVKWVNHEDLSNDLFEIAMCHLQISPTEEQSISGYLTGSTASDVDCFTIKLERKTC